MARQMPLLHPSLLIILLTLSQSATVRAVELSPSLLSKRDSSPLDADTPSPEDGPAFSANALRDTTYLPAQIGGIIGAYALSLILVAIALLSLSKKRREHINAGHDEVDFEDPKNSKATVGLLSIIPPDQFQCLSPDGPVPNFSYPSPRKSEFELAEVPIIHHSPASSVGHPGISPFVDQRVVAADKAMAQDQLEAMYKHVMEHEEAKQKGITLDAPAYGTAGESRPASVEKPVPAALKKEKVKPASLNLNKAKGEKSSGSRTASFLSALRSPKSKSSVKGVSISSPMMTPQSASFPRHHEAPPSMGSIPPRHYQPASPPPVPGMARSRTSAAPISPDHSPESVQSIDERIGTQLDMRGVRVDGRAPLGEHPPDRTPESATSEHSAAPLVGLPTSPKPGATFDRSLPSSPKPGASFGRQNAPSAVRTGGALPLRAYEPALASPSVVPQTTQTVFQRMGPLTPMTGRTPGTGVPYTPYQPFSPVVPITPSLVTKDDRKRMKKMVPKTPTMELVQSSEDLW